MAVSCASYSLQGLDSIVHISMSPWPFATTTLKRFSNNCIDNEQLYTASKKTTKVLRKLTCLQRIHFALHYILHTSYALLVISLLGGNRNHVTTNYANPQLRNAPILIFPVRGCLWMRSRISLCIRVILKHYTFTLEGGLLGHYPAGKIQKTN